MVPESFSDPQWGKDQLKRISLFKNITDEELMALYKLGRVKEIHAKSNIVIEGESSRGIYILLAGTVSVFKNNASNNSMIRLAYLEKGASFGELSLFDEAARSATVVAETSCNLFSLEEPVFRKFMDAQGDNIKMRFYKKCAEEMVERFRSQNSDYIMSQQLLWKYALSKPEKEAGITVS